MKLIKKYFPDVALTTDIIVGFPGETEIDFEDTLNFVKEIGFSKVHVFKYSPRKGTPAFDFKNQVDGNTKKDRSNRLINLSDELSKKFLSDNLFKQHEVLFEENTNGNKLTGYSRNYIRFSIPYIEGVKNKIVNCKGISIDGDEIFGVAEEVK